MNQAAPSRKTKYWTLFSSMGNRTMTSTQILGTLRYLDGWPRGRYIRCGGLGRNRRSWRETFYVKELVVWMEDGSEPEVSGAVCKSWHLIKRLTKWFFFGLRKKLLTDEEFLFLYEANKPVNLELPYYEYEEFNLEEDISKAECKAEFQFERGDIERLADVLQLPPTFECPQGSVCDSIKGLCILLCWLAYPCHYNDMVSRFTRPVPVLCMISNIVLNYIYDLHHQRITTWNQAWNQSTCS